MEIPLRDISHLQDHRGSDSHAQAWHVQLGWLGLVRTFLAVSTITDLSNENAYCHQDTQASKACWSYLSNRHVSCLVSPAQVCVFLNMTIEKKTFFFLFLGSCFTA